MIHEVFSTMPSFKGLKFQTGLNVLVADRTDTSTDRQTRNRAGKSSLVEVIHFLLGAKPNKESIFRNKSLQDFKFGLRFDLEGQEVATQRTGSEHSRIFIEAR